MSLYNSKSMSLSKILSSIALTTVVGCTTVTTPSKTIDDLLYTSCADGQYDNTDMCIPRGIIPSVLDNTYMVINKATYKGVTGATEVSISLGTANVYRDIGPQTYLTTAKHVVENDKVAYDGVGNEYFLKKTDLYLLRNSEVQYVHDRMKEDMKLEDILNKMKLTPVSSVAEHKTLDVALLKATNHKHVPLAYTIGDANELRPSDKVVVFGYPLGYIQSVNEGKVSSVNGVGFDEHTKETFIFDASITFGNSGGGVFAVRDGMLELVGITSAMVRRGNDFNIAYKTDKFKGLFNTTGFRCSDEWLCKK